MLLICFSFIFSLTNVLHALFDSKLPFLNANASDVRRSAYGACEFCLNTTTSDTCPNLRRKRFQKGNVQQTQITTFRYGRQYLLRNSGLYAPLTHNIRYAVFFTYSISCTTVATNLRI